jgi:hypothetical protein
MHATASQKLVPRTATTQTRRPAFPTHERPGPGQLLKFAITLNDQQLKREIAFYEEVIKVKADVAALLTFLVLCATLLKASGADIKFMQELLRHASTRVTLDTYTQAVTPAKRAAQTAVVTQFFPSAKTA